jgi:hypothetical protein
MDLIFSQQMPDVARTVVVVDNALPPGVVEASRDRTVIGGDNSGREFTAIDMGLRHAGRAVWTYDLVNVVTDAFHILYVDYLARFTTPLLKAICNRPAAVGHIDCYNEPVEILNFHTQHWIRSCFMFLPPTEVKLLGELTTVRDGKAFFSGAPGDPFRPDAPLSATYRKYIVDWLTGQDIGQGVTWHSSFGLTAETLPAFQAKAIAIMNEQMLGVRLRAMGCRLIDVTWLSTMLAAGRPVSWRTPWREQLENRDRDALRLTTCA